PHARQAVPELKRSPDPGFGSETDLKGRAHAVLGRAGPGGAGREVGLAIRRVRVRVVDLDLDALAAQVGVDGRGLLVEVVAGQRAVDGRRPVARLVRAVDAGGHLHAPADHEVARLQVAALVAARRVHAAWLLVAPEPFGLKRGPAPQRLQLGATLPDR